MESINHYNVLGVPSNASYEEIKAAFHALALQSHPDKQQQQQNWSNKSNNDGGGDNNPAETDEVSCGEEEDQKSKYDFKQIQAAWKVLRDPTTRSAYDEEVAQKSLNEQSKEQGMVTLTAKEDGVEEAYDEELEQSLWVYDCRCGEEVIFEPSTEETDGCKTTMNSAAMVADCPGCCFVYKFQP